MKPNIIIMNMDNLGYGDLACYGSRLNSTNNVDKLAAEGMRFTNFYSASGVCTASRASLMTGCYPRRVNMHQGDRQAVLSPVEKKGLNPAETTLARILKDAGCATACVGKWHLGDQPEFLPTRHGFDEFFGCPYSEDMTPDINGIDVELPLMRNEEVIEAPPDRNYLTRRYTEEGVKFIRKNKGGPFFLYLAYAMPGSCPKPFVSPEFRGKSKNGIYGDCVGELDWSAGEIVKTLKELGIEENTLIIWTSDNGAEYHDPPKGGSNAPLRGWAYDTSEGAMRVPCIVRWPGKIPAGRVEDRVATMMDIFPTAAEISGARVPAGVKIDGYDISGMLLGDSESASPYDSAGFFYYKTRQLQAVRSGPWKLYLPLEKKLGQRGASAELELYNLELDMSEEKEVSGENPGVVKRLTGLAERIRKDIGDMDAEGAGQRPAGYVDKASPRLLYL